MFLLIKNLKAREKTLEKLISMKKEALIASVQGHLEIHARNGNPQFYMATRKDKKTKRKYIGRNSLMAASALAQKDYDLAVMRSAEEELKVLRPLIRKYEKGIAEDIYPKLHPERRNLVVPFFPSDEEYIQKWLDEPYDRPGFSEGDPEFYSDKEIRVRSKSEILIANKYDYNNIPVKYEVPTYLDGFGWVNPDFTMLNIRLRKEYIHEHFGKMDDPEYAARNIAKLNAYMKNGYFPGKNFICTFETQKEPFDARIMDDIINTYLK